jgi:hypothetical protein
MARPCVGAERILEVIKELEGQGKELTVTAVREQLGTGSFSTIGAVLSDWRQSKAKEARPAVPEPPESVRGLFGQLWAEAWAAVMRVHEPERQAFARDRQEFERGKGEMLSGDRNRDAASIVSPGTSCVPVSSLRSTWSRVTTITAATSGVRWQNWRRGTAPDRLSLARAPLP